MSDDEELEPEAEVEVVAAIEEPVDDEVDDRPPSALHGEFAKLVPSWTAEILKLPEEAGRAWDERVHRINAMTATDDDRRIQEEAEQALQSGAQLSPEAMRMPTQRASPRRTGNWRPMHLDTEDRAVNVGVPPLIAKRIIAGEKFETRSTRACSRVGLDYMILVLIGDRGCGKSFAAADWLWSSPRDVPTSLDQKAAPRRFIEADTLFNVPFKDHPKLMLATALAVDDAGVEHESLIPQWAGIFIARYRNALPTVITTNLSEHDFSERYGMRFASRMKEVGRFVVVATSALDDLRGRT